MLFPGAGHNFTGKLWALVSDSSATALALEGADGMSAAQCLLPWEANVLGVDASSCTSDVVGVVRPGGRGGIEMVPTPTTWVAFGSGCVVIAVAVILG